MVNPYQLDFLASRGCPYNCSYCSNHALRKLLLGKYVRQRSPRNVIQEIKHNLKKYWHKGFRYVYFWDETFILNKSFLHKFCNLFRTTGLSRYLAWNCTARGDLLQEEDVQLMKQANCNIIRMGIEAGDSYIRNKIYNRNMSLKSILNAVKLCRKYGIANQLNFMFGGPSETMDTMQKTFLLAQTLNPEQISLNIFQPLPATNATKTLENNQGIIQEKYWSNMHNFYYKSMIDTSNLKKNQIEKFKRKVDSYFITEFIKRGFYEVKMKFMKDILSFFLFLKIKYDFHLHDAYKYTLRRYTYERNLSYR